MYENDKNDQNLNQQNTSGTYGSNPGYGNTPGATNYGTGYSANGTTGSGNYSGTTGSGNYSGNANYNSGNYGNYQYGNYQYGNYQQPIPPRPPKKSGTGKKVAAVIAVALVLVLGLGAGYYSMTKIKDKVADLTQKQDQASIGESAEEQAPSEDVQVETKEDAADEASTEEQAAAQSDATADSSAGISKTETTTTTAVVTDVTDVVKAAMPSIVSINNNYTQSAVYFGQKYSEQLTASGSGIIVGTNDSELLIATNYHVIEGADSLEVLFVDDSTAAAEVKGTNSDMDLAVIAVQLSNLSIETKNSIAIATLGDSDSLVVGEPAIAIGNALGYGQSVTTGVVSAVNRMIDLDDSDESDGNTFIQTDAAINPGNSGGALLNIKGEVIGINSNKIGGSTIEGMGYAIPISVAKPIIKQLMTEQTKAKVAEADRGYIGISGVSVTSDVSEMYGIPEGVYVATITAGGGAEAAGLRVGDIIVALDGQEISSMDDLKTRLEYYAAGTTATLKVMRQSADGYAEQEFQVTLGSATQTQAEDQNGAGQETYEGTPNEGQGEGEDGYNGYNFQSPFGSFGFGFGN